MFSFSYVKKSHVFAPPKKKILDNLVSVPVNDQGNRTALMSDVLVIPSPDKKIKVVEILSQSKTNYAGKKSEEGGYILILKKYLFLKHTHRLSNISIVK